MSKTEYSDFKVDPVLGDVVTETAEEQFEKEFRAKSRAGHEALVAWLIFRADPDVRDGVLDDHGFDSVSDLVDYLAEGRFANDDKFDPLASVRTRRGDD